MYSSSITRWDAGGKCTYAGKIDVSETFFFRKPSRGCLAQALMGRSQDPVCSVVEGAARRPEKMEESEEEERTNGFEQRSTSRTRSTEIYIQHAP